MDGVVMSPEPTSTGGVTQTMFADREDGIPGNCLQAAYASLFGMRLEAVPHFVLFDAWVQAMDLWLAGVGMKRLSDDSGVIPDERSLVIGLSPRGVQHVCVGEHGHVVWDPHPSRAGLVEIRGAWTFEEVFGG